MIRDNRFVRPAILLITPWTFRRATLNLRGMRPLMAPRVATVLLAVIVLAAPACEAVPSGTTEYSTVQIANNEWAPESSFGNTQASLQLGVESNKANTFQDIGFGYVGNSLQYKPPAVIAYEQTSTDGETKAGA